jgi:hypothetical protein
MLHPLFSENLKQLALKLGISCVTAITGHSKSGAMNLLSLLGSAPSADFEGFQSSSCPLAVD